MSDPSPTGPAFVETRIRSSDAVAAEQRIVVLEPPAGFLEKYQRAGQYCRVRVGADEGYFALFSTPAERQLRFLVKTAGIGERLASLPVGAALSLTPPAGPGFDLEAAVDRDLIFAAGGTGIGPIRPAIEAALDRADGGALSLFYGVWDEEHVAVAADLERWSARGVRVRLCVSRDEPGRYVQDAIADDRPDLTRTAFVVAGRPEMVTAITALVREGGGSDRWVLRNF